MQKVRFFFRRSFELAVVGYVLFVMLNVGAELLHKPLLADRAAMPHGLIHPAAHVK